MTDIGYDGIIKRISEMKLEATPKNCSLSELFNWTQGYAAAVHNITCMIADLKESSTQQKKEERIMVKVYCDRCGKELIKHEDNPWHSNLVEAANGDEVFFTVSVYNKATPSDLYPTKSDDNTCFNGSYLYYSPDLCPDCMREINQAVKTVWDGKRPRTLSELYGMIDDENKTS